MGEILGEGGMICGGGMGEVWGRYDLGEVARAHLRAGESDLGRVIWGE